MLSILEVKRKLPKDFIDNLYETYTPGNVDKILSGMKDKRITTLRVNTIKYNIRDLMNYLREHNIKFDRILWYDDALIIKNADEKDIQKLDIYENGFIYLQSLSSMIPALVLEPKENEKVLDLTAAPGSKTTQMAMMMKNRGYILANELDKIRCERLLYNVNTQGAEIVETNNGRGEVIGKKYPEFFDKVLLDAPCSGEGRFVASDSKTYRSWSAKTVKELSNLQKKLFKSAYDSLKMNGIMVYSTCTLNQEENEKVLDWALNNFNIKILTIDLNVQGSIHGISENYDKSVKNAIRVLPSNNMEGFFVCKLQKV